MKIFITQEEFDRVKDNPEVTFHFGATINIDGEEYLTQDVTYHTHRSGEGVLISGTCVPECRVEL